MSTKTCHLSCHHSAAKKYPTKQEKCHRITSKRSVSSALLKHIQSNKYLVIKQDRKQYICDACIEYTTYELSQRGDQNESDNSESDDPESLSQDDIGQTEKQFKSVLKDLRSGKLSISQVKVLSKTLGQVISKSVKAQNQSTSDRLDVTNVKSYKEEWEDVNPFVKSLFEGIVDVATKDEEETSRRKVCLVKSVDSLIKAQNSHYISTQGLAENLVCYYFARSKLATTLFGKFGGGASYTTISRLISHLAERTVKFPTGDLYISFDNQQVIGQHHRVSFEPRERVSVVTSICCFSGVNNTTFQYKKLKHNIIDPSQLTDEEKEELFKKYKNFTVKAKEKISDYRYDFVKERLKKIESECKKDENNEVVDDLFSVSYEHVEEIGLNYNRVTEKGTNVHVHDMPVIFVNPNSFKTVSTVLEHLSNESFKSDENRKWIAVVCDGLPFDLCYQLIKNSHICRVCKETVIVKKGEINHSCDVDISVGYRTHNKQFKKKFPKIVLRAGSGHFEMSLVKVILNIYFDVYIHALANLCNFKTQNSQEYIRKGNNHHKSWQLMRILMESLSDELFFAYMEQKSPSTPTVEGFRKWLDKNKNPNVTIASTCVFSVLHTLFLYRAAIRRCNSIVALMARDRLSALFYGFNNLKYRKISAADTLFCLSIEGDEKEFIMQQSVRYVKALYGEGHDFQLEWRNKLMKKWLKSLGIPTAEKWLEVSTALEVLELIKEKVFSRSGVSVEEVKTRTVKMNVEIREFRRLIRNSNIFGKTVTKIQYLGNTGVKPSEQLLTFMNTCESNKEIYYKEFIYGNDCKLKTLNADGSTAGNNRTSLQLKRDISLKLSYFPEPFQYEFTKKLQNISNVDDLFEFETVVEEELIEIRQKEYERMVPSVDSDED